MRREREHGRTARRAARRRLALGCVLAALLPARAGADPLLRPAKLSSEEYAETFTFVADLDDGTYVQVQLAVTNLGPGSGTGLCRALVKRPGADAWTAYARVPQKQWSHARAGAGERLSVGACEATAADGMQVRAVLEGRRVELAFPRGPQRRTPPGARLQAGKASYAASILQSFTPVRAALTLPPAAPVVLEGGGYADHSRSDVPTESLAKAWVRFRALRGEARLIALGRQAPDGAFGPVWLWREGQEPVSWKTFELQRADGGAQVRLDGDGGPARIEARALLYRHAPLEELGALGRAYGAFAKAPVTYTWRADLTVGQGPPIGGVLETTLFE